MTKSPTLADRLRLWREAFTNSENSVERTLTSLARQHAIFLSIAKSVDLVRVDKRGRELPNPDALDLLAAAYWSSMIAATRRLIGRGALRDRNGVSSLRAIVCDIQTHQQWIDRRTYLETIAGLEYHLEEAVEGGYWEFIRHDINGEAIAIAVDLNASPTRWRHEQFDFLSGVAAADRRPDDSILPEVFDRLHVRLDRIHDIAEQATIHFASAASDESTSARIENFGIEKAGEAIRVLVETATLVGRWFLHCPSRNVVPMPQDNPFRHVDISLVHTCDIAPLWEEWERFSKEAEVWVQLDDADL